MHYFSAYFGKDLCMFQTYLLSIIRSYVDWLLARSGSILTSLADSITSMTNTYYYEYSIKTPDDGQ